MFENIIWSDKSFTLREFVENFSLPQLVQVESGIYSEDEAKTLSAGQILTLHFTKKTDKVVAKATGTKQFFIPVNCPCKVEILPTICEDMYYSVQDIVEATSIQFIRVVHDSPPSFRLKAGDILQLKNTVEENHGKFIECEFVDKTRDLVRLPLEFKAAFEPLASTKEYYFQEVLTLFKFPVRVKFISGDITIQDVNSEVDLPSLGSVLLKEINEESTVICTSRADDNVAVLMIPTDLEVSVRPAEGALMGDETYARFCRKIHDGADLEKVDLSMINASRLCGERDVEFLYEYVEMTPPVPPRSPGGLEPGSEHSDSCEEYVDLRPPRPPKTAKFVSPPKSPKQTAPQQPQYEGSELERQTSSDNPEGNVVPSLGDDDIPRPPLLRTVSTQPSSLTTADRDAYGECCNVPSDDNSPSLAAEDETLMCQTQLCDRDSYDEDENPLAISIANVSLDFPDDLKSLSVAEVGECLKKLKMGKYVELFDSNQIDGELFVTLDGELLSSLGVNAFERKKIMMFINGWRPK